EISKSQQLYRKLNIERLLVWNDHNYCAEIVEGAVPFWAFSDDLLELAKYLGVEGCYQASKVEFSYYGDQGEDKIWSEKVQNLHPYIHDFLNSTPWHEVNTEEKTAEILNRLSVRRAKKLEVRYELKENSVLDPNPRQSFLNTTNQGITLWIGLEESEKVYPDLIGDALQDYFGISELREFIKDLLLTTDPHRTTLLSWERRGFQPDLCLSPSESDSREDREESPDDVDEQLSNETGSEKDSGMNDSGVEMSRVHEDPETENEDSDSTENKSETPTYQSRPGENRTRQHYGHRSSTPNRSRGTDYSEGGGGEGEEHRTLKECLANNPSQLGEGLTLVRTEYEFESGDRVDILLRDSSGNPVTVEVKPYILPGSYSEVWQAVRYKHIAAVQYKLLSCKQVRSILAAPEIPDDVKAKCEELGIEPFEKPEL
ncbi:MAG: endonuclease NucS, partial [Candidatus Poribacteria bacterium]|nr:endonuclease NucS [Candidatus Poribacteria bacterium]